jgi:clan AA aspartic protease (TIGR02281 family)
MRRLLVLGLFLVAAATAQAASLDPSRMTAIDQAADAFLAKAAEAKKSGQVPRQSDPAVAPLLDTVFDTNVLSHGPINYADIDKLQHWLARVAAVGGVYIAASRAVHDAGLFGPEMARFIDAAVGVMRGIADCITAELDTSAGQQLSPAELHKMEQLRNAISGNLENFVEAYRGPGLTNVWVRERLMVMTTAAPSFARFLKPAQLAHLRGVVVRLNGEIRDKAIRSGLGSLAVALTEPAMPIKPPSDAATASNEIPLESDGHGSFFVSVRINGAMTAKFVVDSGASFVALPQDLMDALTRSGALAASDILGKERYVAADGKRHKSMRLMLRQLDVGGHTVTNVEAGVVPAHAAALLGMSFLAKFKSWTLDNGRHVLIISE